MSTAFVLGQKNLTYDPAGLVALYESYPAVRDSYAQAADWSGHQVQDLLHKRADDKGLSLVTSVGLTAAMLGIADVLAEQGVLPGTVGGLSLGALTAAAVAGALPRREVVRLLCDTDASDVPESPEHPEGCVAAVLPLGQSVEGFYGTRPGVWFSGDFGMHVSGAFRMVLLSGHREALDRLAAEHPPEYFVFSEEPIAVHSPLRHRARDITARLTAGIEFGDPAVPLCSSLEERTLFTGAEVRSMVARNVVEPVHTDRLAREMRRQGARLGLVLGPTLPRDAFEFPFPVVHIEAPEDVAAAVAAVTEHGGGTVTGQTATTAQSADSPQTEGRTRA
ncbi:acyltransferase domain-containing protein [Streptacidiphilus sp. EB129]|uniref:acyltransferase domain-containing protein n=1 Tax=Streptacidiphilus sp. EB129 TaxID=3156262 RepID=UPI0035171A97